MVKVDNVYKVGRMLGDGFPVRQRRWFGTLRGFGVS